MHRLARASTRALLRRVKSTAAAPTHEAASVVGIYSDEHMAMRASLRTLIDREINPRKCIGILTKILWLLSQGDTLTANETTDIFFGVTKLLQNILSSANHFIRWMHQTCRVVPSQSSAEDEVSPRQGRIWRPKQII